jgi:hypothetical protein
MRGFQQFSATVGQLGALLRFGRHIVLALLVAGCRRCTPAPMDAGDAGTVGGDAGSDAATAAPQLPAARSASAATTSESGRYVALVVSAGAKGSNELVVFDGSDLRVVLRHRLGGLRYGEGPTSQFAFSGDAILRVSDAGSSAEAIPSETLVFEIPSGRVLERWPLDEVDGRMILFRGGGGALPRVELASVAAPDDPLAPGTFIVTTELRAERHSVDLTPAARRAVGDANVKVLAQELVGPTLVLLLRSASARFDWRVAFFDLNTRRATFLPNVFGPGGSVALAGSKLLAAPGAGKDVLMVDLPTHRVERTFRVPRGDGEGRDEDDPIASTSTCVALDAGRSTVVLGQAKTSGEKAATRWFDAASGKRLGTAAGAAFGTPTRWRACTVAATKERVVTFSHKGFVAVADAKTGGILLTRDDGEPTSPWAAIGNDQYTSTALLSPDLRFYAIASRFGGARRKTKVVDLASGAETELLLDAPLAFANGGEWLVADDGVWSVKERRRVADLP